MSSTVASIRAITPKNGWRNVQTTGDLRRKAAASIHDVMKSLGEPVIENTQIRGIDVTTEWRWGCGCEIASEKRLAASMIFYEPCTQHERRSVPRLA